ncbi:MAG: hypothetical protein LH472_09710 [Pyrinomonadaceae bacterium]|nr:hypothetical protein [Pyrinomonadaceae bacterium]
MSRDLTTGERRVARELYGSSINYSEVKIHDGKYFFGQPDNSGMTPNGEIYASSGAYHADYSVENASTQGFLVHEMGHVWQYQNSILNVIWSAILEQIEHGLDYNKAYPYLLDANKTLTDYDIEQQASILEDYFRVVKRGIEFRQGRIQNGGDRTEKVRLLRAVLADFITDPSLPNR